MADVGVITKKVFEEINAKNGGVLPSSIWYYF